MHQLTPCSQCGVPHATNAPRCPRCGTARSGPRPTERFDARLSPARTHPPLPQAGSGLDPSETSSSAIGRYVIDAELGRGGMGVVYRAHDPALDRSVAIKMLLPDESDPESTDRFVREARVVARLRHPGIVSVHEAGVSGGRPFIVMDLVAGEDLETYLDRTSPDAKLVAKIGAEIARALSHAHAHGVIHRDVKPQNILIDADGHARLSDFGLAGDAEAGGSRRLTVTGVVVGTPAYMAPEQALGRASGAAVEIDIWALGAVIYRGLVGRPPFQGESVIDVMQQIVLDEPVAARTRDPSIPRSIDAIVMKCLERRPEDRFRSAAELADELERFVAGRSVRTRPSNALYRSLRWVRKNVAVVATLTAIAATATAGAAWLWGVAGNERARELEAEVARLRDEADRRDGAPPDAPPAPKPAVPETAALSFALSTSKGIGRHDVALFLTAHQAARRPDDPAARLTFRWSAAQSPRVVAELAPPGLDDDLTAEVIAAGPDGEPIITAGNVIASWSPREGSIAWRLPVPRGHRPIGVAISPTGERAAVTFRMAGGRTSTRRVDLEMGAWIRDEIDAPFVGSVALIAEDRLLGPVGADGRLEVHRFGGGSVEADLPDVARVEAVDPSGRYAALRREDGSVSLLSLATGETLGGPIAQTLAARVLAVGPRGERLVVADGNGARHVVDITSGGSEASSARLERAIAAGFSPDGSTLAGLGRRSGRPTLVVSRGQADYVTGGGLPGGVAVARISPDARRIFVSSGEAAVVLTRASREAPGHRARLQAPATIRDAAWSSADRVRAVLSDGRIVSWELGAAETSSAPRELAALDAPEGVAAFGATPDEVYLGAGDEGILLHAIHPDRDPARRTFRGEATAVAPGMDPDHTIVGLADGSLGRFGAQATTPQRITSGPGERIDAVACYAPGKFVALVDGQAALIEAGIHARHVITGPRGHVSALAISRTRELFAIADDHGEIRIFVSSTLESIATLTGTRAVSALDIDDSSVLAGFDDGSARLWTLPPRIAAVVRGGAAPVVATGPGRILVASGGAGPSKAGAVGLDLEKGTRALHTVGAPVTAASLAPGLPAKLAFADRDGLVHVFDPDQRRIESLTGSVVVGLAWTARGLVGLSRDRNGLTAHLVEGEGRIRSRRVPADAFSFGFSGRAELIAASPDGIASLALGPDGLGLPETLANPFPGRAASVVAVGGPDDELIAVLAHPQPGSRRTALALYNRTLAEVQWVAHATTADATSVAISPSGASVALGIGRSVWIRSGADGALAGLAGSFPSRVDALAFSADGATLVVGARHHWHFVPSGERIAENATDELIRETLEMSDTMFRDGAVIARPVRVLTETELDR